MHILGIETSCDETAISIVRAENGICKVLSDVVSSQVKLHAEWGGVVPNLAAREHLKNIPQVLQEALTAAKMTPAEIDLLAVTQGPGLIPALMIGVTTAKTLAYLWQKPLLGIHHIEGHIYANFISNEANEALEANETNFPILCLVVSGGHTQLVLMRDHMQYEIIGETQDDAAGEAFDKVARILNLGYPGGPVVANAATKYNPQDTNYKLDLPRPMINKNNFDFSFSGLKTAVLYETKKHPELLNDENYVNTVAREFQQAVIDVLVHKTIEAAKKYNPRTIMLAGGVSANKELRKQLGEAITEKLPNTEYSVLDAKLSGDNAAMIAIAAGYRWQRLSAEEKLEARSGWQKVQADAGLELASLAAKASLASLE